MRQNRARRGKKWHNVEGEEEKKSTFTTFFLLLVTSGIESTLLRMYLGLN